MQLFNRYVSPGHLAVFTGEAALIFGSMILAAQLLHPREDPLTAAWKIAIATALCLLCLYYNDCYDFTVVRSNRELVIRLLQAIGIASILLAIVYLAAPSLAVAHGAFPAAMALFVTGILLLRVVFNRINDLPPLGERLLFVGAGPTARLVARAVAEQRDFPSQIVGFVDDAPAAEGTPGLVGAPDELEQLVRELAVDRVIVGLPDRRGRLPVAPLLRVKLGGTRVEEAGALYERLTGKLLLEDLRPSALIFSDGFRVSRLTRLTKRLFDLALAGVGLLLAWPLMALVAAAIRLESGAPVLYRQERVGLHGRRFVLLKFRSMRQDAEQGVPLWARDDDARVTRVGRILRQTRLDELPQLWNVLRGDMSFVGPRPERPFFVEQLAALLPFYEQRHAVRPGITGWAQVKYRYGASLEDAREKLRYDLYYIKHLSIAFDATILVDTVKVVLFGKGAR
ncbi:MAG TPA: TIGR03013 family XrtA/PEP-CTERM system glycosyltransferase [Vicinamibacterales bacterium]|nr:TIGR03013 family XrtA/PEP-CTERM system glycosyltransferase [Vicinamibacterales bacterium]